MTKSTHFLVVKMIDTVKDYAFVHMERAEDAVEAIRGLDNTEFQGEPSSLGKRAEHKALCRE